MFYSLNEQYRLRGWEKLPTGVVRHLAGNVVFLDPGLYSMIRNNSWMLFQGSPFLDEQKKEFFEEMVKLGIVELTETIRPLTEEQQYRLYPNRYLFAVHWAITGNCNCRCRHCYMSAPTGNIGEYSHEQCMDIIRQFEEAGVQQVSLTGGEALVRRDFLDIAKALTDAGIKISVIMSNGLLVNEKLLDALEEMGQKPEFNMSFDGIGCHDWLRGVSGVEEAVIRAFKLGRERGFPTGAEYCLRKGNMSAFRESVKLLSDLGCRSLKVNIIKEEGEAVQIHDEILTQDEEYQFYLDYLPHYYEDRIPMRLMLSGFFKANGYQGTAFIPFEKQSEDEDCSNYCLCGHARNWMHITADGYIVPCIPIGSVECGKAYFPKISDMSIRETLRDSRYMDFIDTRLRTYFEWNPECESCEYRNRCAGGCRGQAAYGGSLTGKDESACAFYKNGWYDKVKSQLEQLSPKA